MWCMRKSRLRIFVINEYVTWRWGHTKIRKRSVWRRKGSGMIPAQSWNYLNQLQNNNSNQNIRKMFGRDLLNIISQEERVTRFVQPKLPPQAVAIPPGPHRGSSGGKWFRPNHLDVSGPHTHLNASSSVRLDRRNAWIQTEKNNYEPPPFPTKLDLNWFWIQVQWSSKLILNCKKLLWTTIYKFPIWPGLNAQEMAWKWSLNIVQKRLDGIWVDWNPWKRANWIQIGSWIDWGVRSDFKQFREHKFTNLELIKIDQKLIKSLWL